MVDSCKPSFSSLFALALPSPAHAPSMDAVETVPAAAKNCRLFIISMLPPFG